MTQEKYMEFLKKLGIMINIEVILEKPICGDSMIKANFNANGKINGIDLKNLCFDYS